MLGAPNVELAPNTFLLALAGLGAEPSPPKKPPPPLLLPFPPAPPPLPRSECLRVGGVGGLLPDDND